VSQRGPDTSSRYSTRDQPVNNFNQNNQSSIARGPGASRGAAPKGSAQSGIYPQPTRMTTAQVPGSQPKGDTWNAPYRDETPSGYSTDYNTELGSTQKVEKSILPALLIKLYETDEFGAQDHTGTMMMAELEKAAHAGRAGGAMGYQEEDIHAAGAPEKMDEQTKRKILDQAKAADMKEA